MKTAATNKKVGELKKAVREGTLIPKPEFQRRLVWTNKDKERFLDTVLKGLPFPEIYLAHGDIDLESGEGTQLLVDGLQRVSTLIAYIDGNPELALTSIPPYSDLSDADKENFLLYDVAVRDLGKVSRDMIVEVFQRINATKYSLNDIEINNAVYCGEMRQFASSVAQHEFFSNHDVFTGQDMRRMGDLRFALAITCTMLCGYFNRDEVFEEILARYNDDFPLSHPIWVRVTRTLEFIDECGFDRHSRVWKKADLLTLIIEVDRQLFQLDTSLQPSDVVEALVPFYHDVDRGSPDGTDLESVYYKAALQASNDRLNRVRRGTIVGGLIQKLDRVEIRKQLMDDGLVR
jgi:hypothetical protein